MPIISEKARAHRNAYMREYMRQYKAKNREELNAKERERYKQNPRPTMERQARYWERKAEQAEQQEG